MTKRRSLDRDFLEIHPLIERLGEHDGWMSSRVRRALQEGVPPSDIRGFPTQLAEALVTAHEVSPQWYVRVQAAFQKHIDSAVSKTVNLPADAPVEEVNRIFRLAHTLGRRCLEAVLSQRDWTVRVLTKNAAVVDDFDLIEKHRDRVLVGLSITGTLDMEDRIEIVEPNASRIDDRMATMGGAASRGLRTYAMLCPLLPGIADSPDQIDTLVKFAVDCKVEEIFVEPVNPRGPGLRQCQEALQLWGYNHEAEALGRTRKRAHWSRYVVELLGNVQRSVRRYFDIDKLRFLLYPSRLLPGDRTRIEKDDAGVIWLGKR